MPLAGATHHLCVVLVSCKFLNMFFFVIAGGTDSAQWLMTSASP